MSASDDLSRRPKPLPDGDSEPFWSAARERRLVMQFCIDCDNWTFPPKPACPSCLGGLEWRQTGGTGTVYSYCVAHMNFVPGYKAPYAVAWIAMDEQDDCRLNANILDCEIGDVQIGMPVEVVFEERGDNVVVPQFRPSHKGDRT